MNEKQQPAGYKMVSSAPYVATLQRYSSLTSSADACSFELKGLTTAEESLLAHVHTPHFHTFSSLLSHEFQHSILPFNMYASSHNAPALMLLFYIFAINSLSPVLFECPTHHRYSNFTTFTTLQLIPSVTTHNKFLGTIMLLQSTFTNSSFSHHASQGSYYFSFLEGLFMPIQHTPDC